MSSPFTPPEADLEIAAPSALELIWLNHRGTVLASIAGVVVLGAAIIGIGLSRESARINSAKALSAASNDEGWKSVIAQFPDSPAAADATLLLAASLRDQGKIEESDALYSRFTENYGRTSLGVSGYLGRASNARVAGKPAEALSAYQQAAAAFPQSYGAPFALFSQFRILAADGRREEAERVIQSLGSQYPYSACALSLGLRPQQAIQGSQNPKAN